MPEHGIQDAAEVLGKTFEDVVESPIEVGEEVDRLVVHGNEPAVVQRTDRISRVVELRLQARHQFTNC